MLAEGLALFFFVLFLICFFFDVGYFLHTGFVIAYGKVFKNRRGILDTCTIGGFCATQDLDIFMRHMNNARFFRDLDFGRFDFYFRTGLYDAISKQKAHALQGATTIRYRRPIPIFSSYKLQTKLVYWEGKDFYLEHKFLTSDNFVRAIALSKQTANVDAAEIIKSLAKDSYKDPEIPQEIKEYQQSMETMSAKLRQKSE